MDWINNIVDDFSNNFLKDFDFSTIILALLLIGALVVTFFSKQIASRFKADESEIETLSVKIKTIVLIGLAAVAVLIMRK